MALRIVERYKKWILINDDVQNPKGDEINSPDEYIQSIRNNIKNHAEVYSIPVFDIDPVKIPELQEDCSRMLERVSIKNIQEPIISIPPPTEEMKAYVKEQIQIGNIPVQSRIWLELVCSYWYNKDRN